MMTGQMTYQVRAVTLGDGVSVAYPKDAEIRFDSSAEQGSPLPGPADLLTAAFAACILKNVERMSVLMPFDYGDAAVIVTAERQDNPPKMTKLSYVLNISTEEPQHRLDLLHRNIREHGTIFNTLAAVCEVNGELVASPRAVDALPATAIEGSRSSG
jgi:uncharacterized OsmC-like protein